MATDKKKKESTTLRQQADTALSEYLDAKPFSYDVNADALYQQYKDSYTRQGRMAMMDTMGQAAALTGGYGSSYAQSVGQQAYQGYMQQLGDMIPTLYQAAYDRWSGDRQAAYDRYAVLADREQQEYSRQRDKISDAQWERTFAYQQQQDALDNERKAADMAYSNALAMWKILGEATPQIAAVLGVPEGTKYDSEEIVAEPVLDTGTGNVPSTPVKPGGLKEMAQSAGSTRLDNAALIATGTSTGRSKVHDDYIAGITENGSPKPTQTDVTKRFVSSHMTKEQAASRGITAKEYTAMVESWINNSDLTDGEVAWLLDYYAIE